LASPGYILFASLVSSRTYLVDLEGRLIHRWVSPYFPGSSAYLLENGHLLRTAYLNSAAFDTPGAGGRVDEYDWDGQLVWAFDYSTSLHRQHHDALQLPNGNVLMIAWETGKRDAGSFGLVI